MIGLALMLAMACLAYGIARWMGADALPFLLVGGFLLARLPVQLPEELVQHAAVMGLTFLAFLAGHELNPHRITPLGRASIIATLVRVPGLGLVGAGAAALLGYQPAAVLVVGLAVGSCSPVMGVRLLSERREFFQPAGRLAAGVLLIQGLALILVLPLLAWPVDGAPAVFSRALGAAALIVVAFAFMRWLARYLVTHLELDEEVTLLVLFSVLALFGGLALVLGLPLLAGAFLAGLALSRFPVNGIVRGYLQSTSDLATALAFTSLGALVTIPGGGDLVLALVLTALVLVLSPLLLAFVGRGDGLTTRPAFRSGVILGQTSEFSLVVVLHAVALGLVANQLLGVVLLVTAVTMLATPLLSRDHRVWDLITGILPWRRRVAGDASGRILFLGLHHTDLPLLTALRDQGRELLIVDDDPALVATVRDLTDGALVADGSSPRVLERLRASRARAVVVTLRPFTAAETCIRSLARPPRPPVIARVRSTGEAERAGSLGAVPVLWAEPIVQDLLEWLEAIGIETDPNAAAGPSATHPPR